MTHNRMLYICINSTLNLWGVFLQDYINFVSDTFVNFFIICMYQCYKLKCVSVNLLWRTYAKVLCYRRSIL